MDSEQEFFSLPKMQHLEFEMLVYLDAICQKHKIPYCLFYGTALGAVRHAGFIPWDDDVDVAILYEDCEKLASAINDDESPYRVLSCFDDTSYRYPYPKMVDTRTVILEPANKPVPELGVFIDLFPIFLLDSDGFRARCKVRTFDVKQKLFCYRFLRNPDSFNTKRLLRTLAFACAYAVFPRDTPAGYLERMIRRLLKGSSGDGEFACSPYDSVTLFPLEWLFPAKKGIFCDAPFPLPRNVEACLKSIYGDDYMTPIKTEHAFHGHAFFRDAQTV